MTYLDYNSTTPLDERVLAEMLPFFTEHFGNASSHTHAFGWYANGAIDKARGQVAHFIGAETSEIRTGRIPPRRPPLADPAWTLHLQGKEA